MKLTTKFPRTISEMLATYGERFYTWKAEEAYAADCDRCEQWHEKNGSLDQQCG